MALAATSARSITTAQYCTASKLWQAQITWLCFYLSQSQADTFIRHNRRQRTFFTEQIFGTKIFWKKDHNKCITSSYLLSQYVSLWILGYLYTTTKMKSIQIIFQSKLDFPKICISQGSVAIFDS